MACTPLAHSQRRRFARRPTQQSAAAEGVAQRDDFGSNYTAPPSQSKKGWGQFAKPRATDDEFPDPDIPPPVKARDDDAVRSTHSPSNRVVDSLPNLDIPHEQSRTTHGQYSGGRLGSRWNDTPTQDTPSRTYNQGLSFRTSSVPSPRWDEPPASDIPQGRARDFRRPSPSVRWDVPASNQQEDMPVDRGTSYRGIARNVSEEGPSIRYSRAGARDEGIDQVSVQDDQPRARWGRHLRPHQREEPPQDRRGEQFGRFDNRDRARNLHENFPAPQRGSDDPYNRRRPQDRNFQGRNFERSARPQAVEHNDASYVSFRPQTFDKQGGVPSQEPRAAVRTGLPRSEPPQVPVHRDRNDSAPAPVEASFEPSTNIYAQLASAAGSASDRVKHEKDSEAKVKRDKRQDRVTKRGGGHDVELSLESMPKRRSRPREEADLESDAFGDEFDDPELDTARKERKKKNKKQQDKIAREQAAKKAAEAAPTIDLPPYIAVGQLATTLKVRLDDFISKIEDLGFEDVANDHVLNFENASLIAMEYGYEARIDKSETEDLKPRPLAANTSILPPRPPVVTIMGHVDHGKTTLLDYLRKSSVAATEHGGITQHIGAFSVPMASGKIITFLDTPGHAAFLSMRQRGANVTDIVVLVVAADDSVKPQTIEAIKHAKAAKVPIIVAINKVDKEEADIEKVKQDLLRHEIEVEDFGGDVQAIPVSGKTGLGLDELEEALVAQAETIDMRAETDGAVEGWVLEASTKKAGRVATVLVRRGTLRPGDIIVAGTTWARVRTLRNEAGVQLPEVGPGTPTEVDGWRDQPNAGDEVLQAPTEQKAHSVVAYREANLSREQDAVDMEAINETRRLDSERREREKAEKVEKEAAGTDGQAKAKSGAVAGSPATAQPVPKKAPEKVELFFLIKADVSGSTEAVENYITSMPLGNHPISINVLRSAVGQISESDVDLIATVPEDCGIIVSFNQPVPPAMAKKAEDAGVKIFDETIIYKVIDRVRALIEDHLPPLITKKVLGEAEAAQVFEINTGGRNFIKIVGCRIRNGIITKGKKVRVYRGGMDEAAIVYDGMFNSLSARTAS